MAQAAVHSKAAVMLFIYCLMFSHFLWGFCVLSLFCYALLSVLNFKGCKSLFLNHLFLHRMVTIVTISADAKETNK